MKTKTSVKKMTEVLTEVLPQKNYNKVLPIIEYLEKNGEISPKETDSNLHPPAHKNGFIQQHMLGRDNLEA